MRRRRNPRTGLNLSQWHLPAFKGLNFRGKQKAFGTVGALKVIASQIFAPILRHLPEESEK